VNDAFLIQYLALGGRLENEDGLPFIEEQKLRAILDYYRLGVEEGFVPADVLDISEPDEIWSSYLAAEVGIAHVTSHRFLEDRGLLHTTRFAAIPTHDGNPVTIGRGRALAVVNHHVDRQAMAARLIEWFMEPDNNAAWTRATAYLPTRYAVFDKMEDSDPYWSFLQSQLEIAVPPPEYDQTGRVLQQAVIEVLSQETSPEEAAAAAVEAIAP
jgi:ABC-type glycerol-3-phosphate transport system substrate-binding protein